MDGLSLVLVVAAMAVPQAPAPNPVAGQTIVFQADYPYSGAEWFAMYADGTRLGHVSTSALVNGVVTYELTGGLPAGQHFMEMEACNSSFGCSSRASLTITVDGAPVSGVPAPPKSLRFIIKL